MTLSQFITKAQAFITKWNTKKPDFDGWYGSQCVDLVQYWNKELGGTPFTGDYAYQIAEQDKGIYMWVDNTETSKVELGDIVVWTKGYNGWAGHVAFGTGKGEVKGEDGDWFEALSVNDPPGREAHLKEYSYNYVDGWLRPITNVVENAPQPPSKNPAQDTIDRITRRIDEKIVDESRANFYRDDLPRLVDDCAKLESTEKNLKWVQDSDYTKTLEIESYERRLKELEENIKAYDDMDNAYAAELQAKASEITSLKQSKETLANQVTSLEKALREAEKKTHATPDETIERFEKEIKDYINIIHRQKDTIERYQLAPSVRFGPYQFILIRE